MKDPFKCFLTNALVGFGLCLLVSLGFSFVRMVGHKEATPCAPFYIDKLEPLVSTRWFCEIIK